jgi:hypothetical protein
MKEVLQLVLETSEYHSKCSSPNAGDAESDRAFVKLVGKYLTKDLTNAVMGSTGHDSVKALHDILKSALFPRKTPRKRKQV